MTSEKSVYNQLNRMLSSPKPGGGTYTYQNDVLGNRTWRNYGQSGVQRYIWDEVNRLKSLCGTSEGARYEYRADGMRVKKITGLTIEWVGDEYSASGYYDENLNQDLPTVRYFYDGQMPMEEDSTYKENSVSVRDYTQYGLGARGIDYIRNVHHSSGATVVFPIYDGHGNMVYTLSRAANETFSLGNKRIYGVWGDLRYDGNPNAGPNTQYCANLGHKKDNESGLIYMRARYYEPWTGRFISEDPIEDGVNYYIYGANDPVNRADIDGQDDALTYLNKVLRFFFFDPRVSNMSLEQLKKSINTTINNLLAKAKLQGELAEYWFAESVAVMNDTPITNHLNEVEKARLAELMQASGARHKAVQTAYLLGASQLRLLLIIIEIGERW